MSARPRLAALGAFRFPFPQGSQAFLGEQARALVAAGADVEVLSYGPGRADAEADADAEEPGGDSKSGGGSEPDAASPQLVQRAIPALLAPRSARSGPHPAKPLADLALAHALAGAHRARPFSAVLAHNAEAVAVARMARALGVRATLVYVAHTLWQYEASAYLPAILCGPRFARGSSEARTYGGGRPPEPAERTSRQRGGGAAERLGRALDARASRASDAVITLTDCAADVLRESARGPVECIPPGLERRPEPSRDEIAAACKAHDLEPGRFALYSGNVDAYQDLEQLAGLEPSREGDEWKQGFPLVIATRDASGLPAALRNTGASSTRLALLRGEREARALRFAAAVHVIPRERPGGFPIKLLNAMETGRPIVACAELAETLEHGRSAWLVEAGGDPSRWRSALHVLSRDPALCERLGRGALDVLAARHDWRRAADHTLAVLEALN